MLKLKIQIIHKKRTLICFLIQIVTEDIFLKLYEKNLKITYNSYRNLKNQDFWQQ